MEAAAEEAAAAVATVAAHRMPPARRPMPLQQNPPCDSRSASRSRSSEFSSVTTAPIFGFLRDFSLVFMGICRTCGHAITPCDSLSALLTVPCSCYSSRP